MNHEEINPTDLKRYEQECKIRFVRSCLLLFCELSLSVAVSELSARSGFLVPFIESFWVTGDINVPGSVLARFVEETEEKKKKNEEEKGFPTKQQATVLCTVSDCFEMGDLFSLMQVRKARHQPLSEEEAWRFFVHACFGVLCLHQRDLLHHDLKCRNMCVGDDGYILCVGMLLMLFCSVVFLHSWAASIVWFLVAADLGSAKVRRSIGPIQSQQQAEHKEVASEQPAVSSVDKAKRALILLRSNPSEEVSRTMLLMQMMLESICKSAPEKRELEYEHPILQKCIAQMPGALDFLLAIGLELKSKPGSAAPVPSAVPAAADVRHEELFLVFPKDRSLDSIRAGLVLMFRPLPLPREVPLSAPSTMHASEGIGSALNMAPEVLRGAPFSGSVFPFQGLVFLFFFFTCCLL